eukprot:CAMPEP_0116835688 /NCGR_PEP_ID=MMETSP0418-20121206/7683_1 /TAXON_ID=1158023 /ORGANISM="Astrosyne radiata, Strain 13vi08-1A" /LENGTH=362 /DNA_ID=CAMNT_0004465381 /DNA_START=90 /DNA_END=1178 /DNA_ORIENTATION=+
MPKLHRKRSASSRDGAAQPYQSTTRKTSKPTTSTTTTTGSGINLVTPNTNLGQHFLKNPAVISSIVQKSAIQPTDVVLEIGPGTGNLTIPLLQVSQRVVALEYDTRMVREVLKRVEQTPEASKLTVMQGDAIATKWPFFDVCVANIPYQISSPVVFKLLAHRPMFRCAVLMVQEEFALRLTARPGEALYCRLSVNCQLLAKVDQLLKVGRNNFRPPPKVESRVVRIELRNPPPPVPFCEWDGMVCTFFHKGTCFSFSLTNAKCNVISVLYCQIRLLFNRKNKTLRSVLMTKPTLKLLETNYKTHLSLKGTSTMEVDENMTIAERVEKVLAKEAWKGQRASKLGLDDFLQLLTDFHQEGIHFA